MQFVVLGPVSASGDGGPVSLGGRKQRTLLAVLLLHANTVVSRGELIDALWGERPPPSASESLDTYVYRLRKELGGDRLVREAGGYRLRVEPGERDVDRFEQLLTSAGRAVDAGDHRDAAARLTEALDLWHGRAWADQLDVGSVCSDAARLEERRLTALESRLEAKLAVGEGAELVSELEHLAGEHPLRERLLAALMLALYRAGRQTDALDAFQAARRRLLDELGLEPGPELHELQQRILGHDPALNAPRRFAGLSGPRRSQTITVAAAAVLLGLVAVVVFGFALSAGAARRRSTLPAGASGVTAVDLTSGRVVTATPLTGAPGAITAGDGSVWVADPADQDVSRINPASGVVTDTILVGGEPGSIVSGGGAIWVASTVAAAVSRIDPGTEAVTQTIHLPGSNPGAIAYGAGHLWVADAGDHELYEIDPTNGSLQRTLSLSVQPAAVAVADGSVWVAGYDSSTVERLDPTTGAVSARVSVGDGPVALAFADHAVWVADNLDATVARIDPSTATVTATLPVGSGPTSLAAAGDSVWVANQYSGTVSRIDPADDRVGATVRLTGAPTSLAVAGGRIWAGVAANSGGHRGGTLVIVTTLPQTSSNKLASIDPAFYHLANNPQFTGLAYDGLVNFQQSAGADGLRLVPDLAVSIPVATDGGRTYAFRIRPGIRYSDGQALHAGDFRRAIERLFRVGSPATTLFDDIVGARACARHPRSCNLAGGIVTNDAAGTVDFHLTVPDPEFLFKLTEYGSSAPIPPGTPDRVTSAHTVPGTGPYRIASISGREIRFVRNPYFREWSHAAQPAGNPNAIVWRTVHSTRVAVTAIEQGKADWLWGQVPSGLYHRVALEDPAQLHSNPQFSIEYVIINTHRAPFDHVQVRQALNYAIDRHTIAQLYGGPRFATPTCQVIAPGLPGYRRYCPYTRHPRADGAWSAPDMTRARQLVRQSGTTGARVDLWGTPDEGFIPPTTTAYVGRVLRALGYHVHVHLVPFDSITAAMWKRFEISVDGDWTVNYPDPSAYIPLFLSCNGGLSNGYYCNPRIDREMRQAQQLTLADPPRSRAIWRTVDRQLTDSAVWVPTVTARDVEITSRRLHNYEYNPLWGFLADQSWVR